jgi:glycosyltransferase involved in cell wall biosynthesis
VVLVEIANGLRNDGMLVVVATPSGGPLEEQLVANGIPVVIDGNITARPEASIRFLHGFDVIGANTLLNWRVVHLARELGKPCIWLVQESRFGLDLIAREGRPARDTFRKADRTIFPSRRTMKLYERYGGAGSHQAIHYGIGDVLHGLASGPAARTADRRLRVVTVGSLEPRKAQHVLLDAVELLERRTRDEMELLLVGRTLSEEYGAKLRARENTIPVQFAGEVSRSRGLELVRNSDIFVCTSLDESGPLVVLEAMALGRPVISTAVGAAAEVIRPGVDGELVEPGNPAALAAALERMLRDPDRRHLLGENARQRYEEYLTSERYRREIAVVFREVLGETGALEASQPHARPAA